MLKKICWGVAFVWVMFMSVGVTLLTINALQAGQAQSSAVDMPQGTQFINGFPLEPGWKGGVFKPPFLTRDQLVQRDRSLQDLIDKDEITNLLYAYVWFHDSGNRQGVISVFTKDSGADIDLWNNNGKQIEGDGCFLVGEALGDLSRSGGSVPVPFPSHSKNVTTNVMIQLHLTTPSAPTVGDTAELHAYYTRVYANNVGEPPVAVAPHTATVDHTGEYIMDLRRTPDGWRFTRHWHPQDVWPQVSKERSSTNPCNAIPKG